MINDRKYKERRAFSEKDLKKSLSPHILEYVRLQMLQWSGTVMGIKSDRILKRVQKSGMKGRKPKKRSRKRLKDYEFHVKTWKRTVRDGQKKITEVTAGFGLYYHWRDRVKKREGSFSDLT